MKTVQKSFLFALASFAALAAASPCAVAQNTVESTVKKQHIKITITKNGKTEVIDETFEGEMPQELKDRIAALETNLPAAARQMETGKKTVVKVCQKDAQGTGTVTEETTDTEAETTHPLSAVERENRVIFIHSNAPEDTDKTIIIKDEDEKTAVFKKILIEEEVTQTAGSKNTEETLKTAETKESQPDRLQFYPNPTTGRFNVSFRLAQKADTEVTIHDVTGREVYREMLKNFTGSYQKEIDLSGRGTGVYVMKVVQGEDVISKKVVVE